MAEIFGLFTIDFTDLDCKLNFILVENLSKIPSEYFIKVYSLKFTQNRRTLMEVDLLKSLTTILKDVDFQNLECYLKIEEHHKDLLIKSIERDVKFFK